MIKCNCCGAELPDGTKECPSCKIWLEPVAKFNPGQLVKCVLNDRTYYNHVVDSYYNRDVGQHLYRLNERMAMPVYREDWLEAVTDEEIERVNSSGRLTPAKRGGWDYRPEEPTQIQEAQV